MTAIRNNSNGQWHWTGIYQTNNSGYQSDNINGGWIQGCMCLNQGINGDGAGGKVEYEFSVPKMMWMMAY